MKKIKQFFLILFGINFLTLSPFAYSAENDLKEIPVKIQIEQFFELILSNLAVEIKPENETPKTFPVQVGAIYLGSVKNFDPAFLWTKKTEVDEFSSTYMTVAKVEMINNVKPFELSIEFILHDPSMQSLLELKQQENPDDSALQIRPRAIPETKYSQNILNNNTWQSIKSTEALPLYESSGAIITDIFEVDFALRYLSLKSKAGNYSGQIIWNFQGTP